MAFSLVVWKFLRPSLGAFLDAAGGLLRQFWAILAALVASRDPWGVQGRHRAAHEGWNGPSGGPTRDRRGNPEAPFGTPSANLEAHSSPKAILQLHSGLSGLFLSPVRAHRAYFGAPFEPSRAIGGPRTGLRGPSGAISEPRSGRAPPKATVAGSAWRHRTHFGTPVTRFVASYGAPPKAPGAGFAWRHRTPFGTPLTRFVGP